MTAQLGDGAASMPLPWLRFLGLHLGLLREISDKPEISNKEGNKSFMK